MITMEQYVPSTNLASCVPRSQLRSEVKGLTLSKVIDEFGFNICFIDQGFSESRLRE